jgi:hypothetical protein
VQQKNDGTHAILPVATHFTCKVDHAGVPVMWLRHSHGKMRRDGLPAAVMQHVCPVDERGELHGASGLAVVEERRVLARIRGPCRRRERKREWVRASRRRDRLERQDKARKVRAVGRGEDESNFKLHPNIASKGDNLSSFTMTRRYTDFDTLR